MTLSFCKESFVHGKILSHGKAGHTVSLISCWQFTNMTILVPARYLCPINGDFWCDSYQSVKKFLYTSCLSPSSVLSDIRLILSALSACYSFRITLKPRVKSFFPVKRNLHLESFADVPLHLNGINSSSWQGCICFTKSASHITSIVGRLFERLKSWDFAWWWSDWLPPSPTRNDTINWVSGYVITDKFAKKHPGSNQSKVLHFLVVTGLPHQNCWIFFTGDTILSIAVKHFIQIPKHLSSLCLVQRLYCLLLGPWKNVLLKAVLPCAGTFSK